MKILVLGGNGFIGKNLCSNLNRVGHSVISFDLEKNSEQLSGITYISGNFFSDDDIIPCLEEAEVVYHAVSTINPGNSNQKYMQGYTCDFLQSVKLCDWSKRYDFKLIYLSSGGTVYGVQEQFPINEETLAIPINHYGNLKLCTENTYRTFHAQFGTNVIIARIANPYGPGQDYSKGVGFIDAALKRAMNGQVINIWGDGSIVRDYIYISDVCRMLVALIAYSGNEIIFNIGSGVGESQKDVIRIIQKKIPDMHIEYLPARPVDVPTIILNNKKILSISEVNCLGIEDGIDKYYNYLQEQELFSIEMAKGNNYE